MTIDSKGNIYLTGKGVTVFDKPVKSSEIFRYLKTGLPMYVSAARTEKSSLLQPAKACTGSVHASEEPIDSKIIVKILTFLLFIL